MPKKNSLISAPSGKAKPGPTKAKTPTSPGEDPPYMGSMGAVVVNKTEANVFALWYDGNLWNCRWSGSQASWANHGLPEGTTNIWPPAGATVVGGNRPYIFTEDDNNNVVVNWLSDKGVWSWSELGQPRAGIDFEYGAVTLGPVPFGDPGPYVYCRGSDYNLWRGCYSNDEWVWVLEGRPSVHIWGSVGITVINDNRPNVFVMDGDQNLWIYWVSDKEIGSWYNLGRPVGRNLAYSLGAVTAGGTATYVFLVGDDGNVWTRFWTGSSWSWTNLKTPNGVAIQFSMGAVVVNVTRPYVFVLGSDGNMWVYWWSDKGVGSWFDLKTPDGVKLWDSMGAVTLGDDNACVFVRCSDGNLWVNSESPQGRAWLNLGTPPVV